STMPLVEWEAAEEQQKFLSLLQLDGPSIPHNLVVNTAIRYTIEKRYPVSRMRFFSTELKTEGTSPLYVFVFEENSKAHSGFYVRPPPSGHDEVILQQALAELMKKYRSRMEVDGDMLMLSDTFTRTVLLNLLLREFPDYADVSPSTINVFYQTDEQIELARNLDLKPIDGFHVDSVQLEKDAAQIHNNWIHSSSLESTTARLQLLPASVVRKSSTGQAVSWDMSSPFGQCSNLFTLPAFRGKGLAVLAQTHLVKSFVSQGLRPFKYVEIGNKNLLESSRRHQLWTRWDQVNESSNKMEGNEDAYNFHFTTIQKKSA
ncbi:hypothetical protein PFISCL1PPCAC_25927, partial [Pristionchus fissidentatus]